MPEKRNTGCTYWEGRNEIIPSHRQHADLHRKSEKNYKKNL